MRVGRAAVTAASAASRGSHTRWTQVPSLFVGLFMNNAFVATNSSIALFTVSRIEIYCFLNYTIVRKYERHELPT